MLSMSVTRVPASSSSSVPPPVIFEKKAVGGSCFGSPTTTTCFARATAPSASTGWIWLASSMTSRSKSNRPGARNCATDKGLIMNTGFSACTAGAAFSMRRRIGMWPRLRAISARSTPSGPTAPPSRAGTA
jgi:hypothetical protein